MDKIIITPDEIEKNYNLNNVPILKRQLIPLWWRLLSGLFILIPPVLFLITIIELVKNRRKGLSVKYAYALHYCWLLIISGVIWIVLWALPNNNFSDKTQKLLTNETSISISAIPQFPSKTSFSGKDIASAFFPMVIAIHHIGMEGIINNERIYGAGVIVNISKEECLILTSKHVINAVSNYQNENQVVLISLSDGQQAIAKVVGTHNTLDLSLLQVHKTRDEKIFLQPVRSYNSIETGESVFVIGHPEGLAFSISNGLVAQKRGEELIQISAPVSPGNSGGPVYDEYGNLIGIVQSVLDKAKKPNAENLNFAVRVDGLINSDKWSLTEDGVDAISVFSIKKQ